MKLLNMKIAYFICLALVSLAKSEKDDKKWVWTDNNRRSSDAEPSDSNSLNRPSVGQIKIKLGDQSDATSNKYTQQGFLDTPSSDDPYDTYDGGPFGGDFRPPPPDYSRPYNPAANIYPPVGGNNYPDANRRPENDRIPGRYPPNGGRYPVSTERYPDNRYPGNNDRFQGGYPNRYPSQGYPGGNRYPSDGNRYPNRYPNNIDRFPGGYPNDGHRYPLGGRPFPSPGLFPDYDAASEGFWPGNPDNFPDNAFRPFRPSQSFNPSQVRPYPPYPSGPAGQQGGGPGNKCACVDRYQCAAPGVLGGQCAPGKNYCCINRPGGFNRPGHVHHPANGVLAGPGGPVDHLQGSLTGNIFNRPYGGPYGAGGGGGYGAGQGYERSAKKKTT